ncbi:protein-glutamate O-methyltransferase CheR|uniref:MCP methyltransferase, CheR-type n=1 Tax=Dendrosporobacter quercicolus TaxID=146817 RepID=A0A1G9Y9A0_9FIRM|nr:protein-glutamate O-methyltransferase CheR [Dendrosporobacter quercicolus]NSL47575.1 protein-glutamate O-methyltransferase CheR [Dendrosporobacter quercicolus DSM 1736]SDN05590.1 MCP methyltransferase, CheR-type [Dendrosporobacter quercicolus]
MKISKLPEPETEENPGERIEIELLLEALYRVHGLEFRNYAYPFVRRRILHRISAERLSTISGLQEKIFHDSGVVARLVADLSINVTEMFRNPDFFQAVRTKIIPKIRDYPEIRIWHAGCSSGEEVFSMAILLYEAGIYHKTRLYATDICEQALQKARQGIIPLERMKIYTKNYHKAGGICAFSEYYTVRNKTVFFSSELKNNVIFAQHNLATDHSFNKFHIIICRNVIIYFNKVLQERVYHLFHNSLSVPGFLGLGEKEGLQYSGIACYYHEVAKEQKIYVKLAGPGTHNL